MKIVSWLLWCCMAVISFVRVNAGGHGGGDKVIIKIPHVVHTIKHTHTIYKTIHHGHKGGGGGGGGGHHSHGGKPFHWH